MVELSDEECYNHRTILARMGSTLPIGMVFLKKHVPTGFRAVEMERKTKKRPRKWLDHRNRRGGSFTALGRLAPLLLIASRTRLMPSW